MAELIRESIKICGNCRIIIANNDTSGMTDEEIAAYDKGEARLEKDGGYLCLGDYALGFQNSPCECCGGLAGDRWEAIVLK